MRTYAKIMKFNIPIGNKSPEEAKKALADLMKEYNTELPYTKNIVFSGSRDNSEPDIEVLPPDDSEKALIWFDDNRYDEDAIPEPSKVKSFFQKLMFWKK